MIIQVYIGSADMDGYLSLCIETLLEKREIKKTLALYCQSVKEVKKITR